MSLLAFEDFSKSPISELVENSQRIKISSNINSNLLKSKSQESGIGLQLCTSFFTFY